MTGKAKKSSLFISELKNWFFYLSYSITSSQARSLKRLGLPNRSTVARSSKNLGDPTTSSEERGLRYLGLPKTSSVARGSRNLGDLTTSNEARGFMHFGQPSISSEGRGFKNFGQPMIGIFFMILLMNFYWRILIRKRLSNFQVYPIISKIIRKN